MQKCSFPFLQYICKLSSLVIPVLEIFEKFTKVYKIIVSNVAHHIEMKMIFDAHHFPNKDVFLPQSWERVKRAQEWYLNLLNNANSNESGCCQYVEDSY